nr:MAG TPA: hypothetical protein [Caudoviricetes sp.]
MSIYFSKFNSIFLSFSILDNSGRSNRHVLR